jgi:hypothetical protein
MELSDINLKTLSSELGHYRNLYVDVDGTLVFWPDPTPGLYQAGKPYTINQELVDKLKLWRLRMPNGVLVVWSGTGKQHAEWAVKTCGIDDIVDVALAKPSAMIDDTLAWLLNESRAALKPSGRLMKNPVVNEEPPPLPDPKDVDMPSMLYYAKMMREHTLTLQQRMDVIRKLAGNMPCECETGVRCTAHTLRDAVAGHFDYERASDPRI